MVIWLVQVIFQYNLFYMLSYWVYIKCIKCCVNRILTWFFCDYLTHLVKLIAVLIKSKAWISDPNVDYLNLFFLLMIYCISILTLRAFVSLTLSVLTIRVPLWTYPPKRTRVSRVIFFSHRFSSRHTCNLFYILKVQ